jgi:hypothetical protein
MLSVEADGQSMFDFLFYVGIARRTSGLCRTASLRLLCFFLPFVCVGATCAGLCGQVPPSLRDEAQVHGSAEMKSKAAFISVHVFFIFILLWMACMFLC